MKKKEQKTDWNDMINLHNGITKPSGKEILLIRMLQIEIKNVIKKNNLNHDRLGKMLDLFPSGIKILFSNYNWGLEKTLRIAEILGINLTFEIIKNGVKK